MIPFLEFLMALVDMSMALADNDATPPELSKPSMMVGVEAFSTLVSGCMNGRGCMMEQLKTPSAP
jgi:hypothetical protein